MWVLKDTINISLFLKEDDFIIKLLNSRIDAFTQDNINARFDRRADFILLLLLLLSYYILNLIKMAKLSYIW